MIIDDPRYDTLMDILKSSSDWVSSNAIIKQFSDRGLRIDIRTIGFFASQSAGRIIGTGDGYRLQDAASDEDILMAYGECIRRAIGTDLRARSIIYYARRHGRLSDDAFEQRKATIRRKIIQETPIPNTEDKAQLALGI